MYIYAITRRMLEQAKNHTGDLLQEVPFELMDEMEKIHLDMTSVLERLLGMEKRICLAFGTDLDAKATYPRPAKKRSMTLFDHVERMLDNDMIDRIPTPVLESYEKELEKRLR